MLEFLRRWLEEWTPAREAAHDWRLLYLDAFRAHLDPSISALAWERGYVAVYHGGCTTGITQVNDTDLHGQLESIYLELESISFAEQQLVDPGNIGRTRQQVMHAGMFAERRGCSCIVFPPCHCPPWGEGFVVSEMSSGGTPVSQAAVLHSRSLTTQLEHGEP